MQVREDEAKKCAEAMKGTPEENAGAATHVGGPKKNAGCMSLRGELSPQTLRPAGSLQLLGCHFCQLLNSVYNQYY